MNDILIQIAVPLAVSVLGGGASMFVAFKIVEQRVSDIEKRLDDHDKTRIVADTRITQIAVDVSYMRGLMENK